MTETDIKAMVKNTLDCLGEIVNLMEQENNAMRQENEILKRILAQ